MGGIISFIFGVIELLVGLRFLLLILGANPLSTFVNWIYNTSAPLVEPFAGVLGHSTSVPTGAVVHSVFDPSTLVAFVVYATIGGVLLALFGHHHGA